MGVAATLIPSATAEPHLFTSRALVPLTLPSPQGEGNHSHSGHGRECCLKNFTMMAGAGAGNWCVPGWMNVTTGAPSFDG